MCMAAIVETGLGRSWCVGPVGRGVAGQAASVAARQPVGPPAGAALERWGCIETPRSSGRGLSENAGMNDLQLEIAATAARLVVEEGLSFGAAKQRALKQLGLPGRTALPSNEEVEAQVREHIAIFCADTQPQELRALREHALLWMERLAEFRPHLGGAVWHGWATRLSDIDLALFCDDPKAAEIALINQNQRYEVQSQPGLHGQPVDVLSIHSFCRPLGEDIGVHLRMYDLQDLRGALVLDAQGRAPRGDVKAVRAKLAADAGQ